MIALRVARAVKGWSAAEAARIAGLNQNYLRDIECGRHRPTPNTVEILRIVYGDELDKAEQHYGQIETRALGRPRVSKPELEPVPASAPAPTIPSCTRSLPSPTGRASTTSSTRPSPF